MALPQSVQDFLNNAQNSTPANNAPANSPSRADQALDNIKRMHSRVSMGIPGTTGRSISIPNPLY
jgi:hypothetical protein